MESGAPMRSFLKEAGIALFRYPDAVDHGYQWDWEAGGVMMKNGKRLASKLAPLDELAGLAREVGAEAKKRALGGSYWCLGNEPELPGPFHVPKEDYVDLVNRQPQDRSPQWWAVVDAYRTSVIQYLTARNETLLPRCP